MLTTASRPVLLFQGSVGVPCPAPTQSVQGPHPQINPKVYARDPSPAPTHSVCRDPNPNPIPQSGPGPQPTTRGCAEA